MSETVKILTAQNVLPVSSEPPENGAVAVCKDKILAVGNTNEISAKYPEAEIENFGEAVIMPGLVNCHSHLELTVMRGFLDDAEDDFFKWLIKLTVTRAEKLSEKDIELSALAGALEGARAGVTTFADIGRYGRAGLNALKANGLRGTIFQETEFSPLDETADTEFKKLKEKFLALRQDETALVKAGLSPHAPYTVSAKLFGKIADYALSENIGISTHVAESISEKEFMENGAGAMAQFYAERGIKFTPPKISSVEYLEKLNVLRAKPLLAHCSEVCESDINLIAASDSSIAHCPKSNAKFGHRTAPFEKFLDRKIRVGFGSDSVASNNICDLLEEGRFAALAARARADKKRFVSAKEIIETATLGGARAMRLEKEIGTLEPGKQADLIVVSLDNVAQLPVHDVYAAVLFASSARDVRLTMVAGREIYRDGKSKMIDEEQLKASLKGLVFG